MLTVVARLLTIPAPNRQRLDRLMHPGQQARVVDPLRNRERGAHVMAGLLTASYFLQYGRTCKT